MKAEKNHKQQNSVLFTLTLLLFTNSSLAAESNLLMNGSVEGEGGWTSVSNSHGYATRSNIRSLDGNYSIRIYDSSTSSGIGAASPVIAVTPGVRYTTRASVFRESGHPPHLYVKYYDESGTQIASNSISAATGSQTWTVVSLTTTAPESAVTAKILPHFISNRTGLAHFDNFEFKREPSDGLVNNQGFEVGKLGAGYPPNWWKWTYNSEPVYLVVDPTNSANKVLKIVDSSTTVSSNAKSYFPVDGGLNYNISAKVLPESGSAPAGVFIKFYDYNGDEIFSKSGFPSGVTGNWETVQFSVSAPAGAEKAAILAYCGVASTCTTYFDDMHVSEMWAASNTRYVSYNGTSPDGLDESDPAKYNDANFWASIQSMVNSYPTRVVFLPGDYPVSAGADRLQLYDCGDDTHRLVLEAESIYGTNFIFSGNTSGAPIIRLHGCTNVSVRNFRFSGDSSQSIATNAGDGLHIHAGSDISRGKYMKIDGISLIDIPNITYGGIKLYGPLFRPSVANSDLIRAGSGAGYHHIYAAGNLAGGSTGMRISNSYFEDATGVYVDVRKNHDDASIRDSFFYSTGTQVTGHYVFLGLYVINDVDPGDEWFGSGYNIVDNRFEYADQGSDAVRVVHKGFNPLDDNGNTRQHLLDESERQVMLNETSQYIPYRRQIMSLNFYLPVNDKVNGICMSENTFVNTKNNVGLWTTEMFGSGTSQTTSGIYDITNLFLSDMCN